MTAKNKNSHLRERFKAGDILRDDYNGKLWIFIPKKMRNGGYCFKIFAYPDIRIYSDYRPRLRLVL